MTAAYYTNITKVWWHLTTKWSWPGTVGWQNRSLRAREQSSRQRRRQPTTWVARAARSKLSSCNIRQKTKTQWTERRCTTQSQYSNKRYSFYKE